MDLKDHPDWHDVVASNWKRTTAYLLALSGPCIQIRDEELERIRGNRVLAGLEADRLSAWRPEGSWFLAVLLCPDDDVSAVAAWVQERGADPSRIHFYAHPEADPWTALKAWGDAGLPDAAVDLDISSWRRLYRRFGRDLAVRILQDWGGT